MLKSQITTKSKEFKWWIRNLPDILTKQQLKEKYTRENMNVMDNGGKTPLSIIRLMEIARENGKTVI